MIIARTAEIVYYCQECCLKVGEGRIITPRSVSLVGYKLDRNKQCDYCDTPLEIISIECKTMPDLFGDEQSGFWECRNDQHDTRYYALALRGAIERHREKSKRPHSYESWTPYERIAQARYPWKCPRCDRELEYKDERDQKMRRKRIGFINDVIFA